MFGANTDELRAGSGEFGASSQLVDGTATTIGAEIQGVLWFGADATAYKTWSESVLVPGIVALSMLLEATSQDLDQQAQEQDDASQPGGGTGSVAQPDIELLADVTPMTDTEYGGDGYGGSGYGDGDGYRPGVPTPAETGTQSSGKPLSERQSLDEILKLYQVNESLFPMVEVKGKRVTVEEATWLADRMFDQDEFMGIENTASQFGREFPGPEDGHGDAMRHTLWNAMMAQKYGEEWTKGFTVAHEMRPGNPAQAEAMDLYNNEVGRRIARENPNASVDELKALVKQAGDNGELLVIDRNGQLQWSDQVKPGETGNSADGAADGRYPGQVGQQTYGK